MRPLDWQVNDSYDQSTVAEALGRIPHYLDAESIDPSWRQIDEQSETGWNPKLPGSGWELLADDYLAFPGLPPVPPAAQARHGLERILVYPAGWVVIVQLDGRFAVGRVA